MNKMFHDEAEFERVLEQVREFGLSPAIRDAFMHTIESMTTVRDILANQVNPNPDLIARCENMISHLERLLAV